MATDDAQPDVATMQLLTRNAGSSSQLPATRSPPRSYGKDMVYLRMESVSPTNMILKRLSSYTAQYGVFGSSFAQPDMVSHRNAFLFQTQSQLHFQLLFRLSNSEFFEFFAAVFQLSSPFRSGTLFVFLF